MHTYCHSPLIVQHLLSVLTEILERCLRRLGIHSHLHMQLRVYIRVSPGPKPLCSYDFEPVRLQLELVFLRLMFYRPNFALRASSQRQLDICWMSASTSNSWIVQLWYQLSSELALLPASHQIAFFSIGNSHRRRQVQWEFMVFLEATSSTATLQDVGF